MPNINASKYGIATGTISQTFSTARTTSASYSNQPSTSNSLAVEFFSCLLYTSDAADE